MLKSLTKHSTQACCKKYYTHLCVKTLKLGPFKAKSKAKPENHKLFPYF